MTNRSEYYEANADRFRTPEQVIVEYVELKKDSFFDQVEVSDEELQELIRSRSPIWPSSVALRISSSRPAVS